MQPGSFWTKKQFNADISGECASQLVEGKQTIAAQRWTFPTLRVTSLYCAKPFTLTFYRQTKLHNGWHLWSHGSKGWMKVPRPSNTHQKVSLIASRKRKSLNIARRSFGLFRLTILLWVLPAFLFDGTNLKEVTLVLTRVFKGELWAGFIPLTLIWKFSLVVKKKSSTNSTSDWTMTMKMNNVVTCFWAEEEHADVVIRHVTHSVCVVTAVTTLLSILLLVSNTGDWWSRELKGLQSKTPRCCGKKDIIIYIIFMALIRQICARLFFKLDVIFSFLSVSLRPNRETKCDLPGRTANLQSDMASAVF